MPILVGDFDMVALEGRERDVNVNDRSLAGLGLMFAKVDLPDCYGMVTFPLGYGCFCGASGPGAPESIPPTDEFDELCLQHDWCYYKAQTSASCIVPFFGWQIDSKYAPYKWDVTDGVAYCGNSYFDCGNAACQCDIDLVNSLRKLIDNGHNCPKKDPGCPQRNSNEK